MHANANNFGLVTADDDEQTEVDEAFDVVEISLGLVDEEDICNRCPCLVRF